MNLAISKCVTAVKVSNFSGHYLRNRSTLDIGVLGYIGIVQRKKHSPDVWPFTSVTPCIPGVTAQSFQLQPQVSASADVASWDSARRSACFCIQ